MHYLKTSLTWTALLRKTDAHNLGQFILNKAIRIVGKVSEISIFERGYYRKFLGAVNQICSFLHSFRQFEWDLGSLFVAKLTLSFILRNDLIKLLTLSSATARELLIPLRCLTSIERTYESLHSLS